MTGFHPGSFDGIHWSFVRDADVHAKIFAQQGSFFLFADLSKHEGELEELKEQLRQVRKDAAAEARRRVEVEKALEDVVTENQQLEDRIMRLEHDHGQLQQEIHNVQVRSIKVRAPCDLASMLKRHRLGRGSSQHKPALKACGSPRFLSLCGNENRKFTF